MENGMKSVDDIAMAAVNTYFQANPTKIAEMDVEDFAGLFARSYYGARKVVKRVVDEQKLNMFPNRVEQAIDGPSKPDLSGEDLGKQFK